METETPGSDNAAKSLIGSIGINNAPRLTLIRGYKTKEDEPMQVTVGELYDAVSALTQLINRPRNIPQLAKFRIAKLHSHLAPFYKNSAKAPLDALIQQYGEEQVDEQGKARGWGVTEQSPKYAEFQTAWEAERQKTVDVGRVSPITWQSFGDASTGGIEANEIIYLGPFVTQPDDELPTEERETNP